MSIYLDNGATTKPAEEVVEKVVQMLTDNFGNPSSFHNEGLKANREMDKSREIIAKSLGVEREEIFFTSGGTEANNLAVFGSAYAKKRRGNRIVTTAIEHESVLESVKQLENEGFEVIYLKPDSTGHISKEQLFDAINKDTILVSMMYVNNEVGTFLPVESIQEAIKKAGADAYIHIDCVQAYGKYVIKPKKLKADLITISSHKVHGPKGVGALYIKKGTRLVSRTYGGQQEKKVRPGTEAAPNIAGFAKAVEIMPSVKDTSEIIAKLNANAKEQLSKIDGVVFNSPEDASSYIINLYVPTFMTGQTVVQCLSRDYDICTSTGSACAKGHRSHVLTSMNLNPAIIDNSLRISFSRYNTQEDVNAVCSAISEICDKYPRKDKSKR